MEAEVRKEFDRCILETFKGKTDLQRFFIKHPRKQLFLTNLCEQIAIIEKRAYKITFEVREYKKLIKDMTKMFCQACLTHAEQRNMSTSQRFAEERRLNKEQHNDELIKDMVKEGLIMDNQDGRALSDEVHEAHNLGADDAPSQSQGKNPGVQGF